MISIRPFDRLGLTVLSLAATTLLAAPAFAHIDAHYPIAGGSLKMSSSSDPKDNYFKFKTTGQLGINPVSLSEDPTAEASSLIVRGTGAFAGSTEIIHLNSGNWSRIGSEEKPKGWKYESDVYDTHSGGITKIQIKSGKTTGSLQIQAKGYYWPFDIVGEQDSIEIVLTIGTYVFCAEFSPTLEADFKTNLEGEVEARDSNPPSTCPRVCGNGVLDTDEECDDGNADTNDTCTNECVGCNPADAVYDTTFEGIQQLIFDAYDCSNDACHGSSQQGGLDLRAGNSYASLVGVTSSIDEEKVRVFPGDQDESILYLKLAMATLDGYEPHTGGTPMPFTGTPITEDQLEAVKLWIRGGASETGVVAGTAELLGSCLPPPTPLNIPQPEVPDPSVGTQMAMPGYLLPPGEVEGCVATYYDISASVPEADLKDCPGAFPGTNETGYRAGKCFTYSENDLYQDAQSHHSIVHIYPGTHTYTDSRWGGWKCYGGPTPDAVCDPSVADACGTDGVCGSKFHKGVACLPTLQEPNWAPVDFDSSSAPQFSGSQESTAQFAFPAGVYSMLPLKGLVVWNSHAFNLTTEDTIMNSWINFTYTSDQTYAAQGMFDNNWIFTQNVPPFQQREYCGTHTFAEGTHLFSLSSHNHKRGVLFRYYNPPQSPPNVAGPCYAPGGSTNASCTPGPGSPFFTSYDYSDATNLHFDPPRIFTGTAAERTVKFCSLYDNGFNDPTTVKRRSQSPVPTGNLIIGGPCDDADVACLSGANKGQLCHGNDSECPGSVCDACPLKGGVTTEDEMFIALGTFYIP
ncbi:MAG TPA: DUF4215 domain-containing protein [Candidatus Limnocylindrales bacterium]|nr:DUF4215 domain-containing protein [Candidatus Limnocylindrales bacterium]